ncbi:hypothetical protein U1Q18_022807, partial [Sarracenia purpurea var. burkii]
GPFGAGFTTESNRSLAAKGKKNKVVDGSSLLCTKMKKALFNFKCLQKRLGRYFFIITFFSL